MAYNPDFEKILEEAKELHNRKNDDYAKTNDPYANFRECERFGIPAWKGVLVRISDKWTRICNLVKKMDEGKEASNEPLEDSFRDLCVYFPIILDLYRKWLVDKEKFKK